MTGTMVGLIFLGFGSLLIWLSRYLWTLRIPEDTTSIAHLPSLVYRNGSPQPLYFVRYEDDSFELANPQPSIFAPPEMKHDDDSKSVVAQLKFLLESAPMIDMVGDVARLKTMNAPYAYVHPITFSRVEAYMCQSKNLTYRIFGSPTQWVVTSLMPRDRVLFSLQPMPGVSNAR